MKQKDKILLDYLEYKKITAHTKNKIDAYKYFVGMFLNSTNKSLKNITEKDVIVFINNISSKYAVSTMTEIKIMLKSFIYWYYDDYPTRFRNLKQICRGQRREKTYTPEQMLTKKDIEKLVQNEHELRWKVYWLLLFYGGFRPKEVCELKWEDIFFEGEEAFIKVHVKKNCRNFEKYIPKEVAYYLKQLQDNGSEYVFPTKRTKKKGAEVGDKPMTRSGVYQRLIPLAKKVLGKHVNPYILRHSIATILYNRDDLKDDDVAQQMGHSKEMKQTYSNLSIKKIRERMKKIYIQSEDLPPEKKKEFEDRIIRLEKIINALLQGKTEEAEDRIVILENVSKYNQIKKQGRKEQTPCFYL
jgi:integrase